MVESFVLTIHIASLTSFYFVKLKDLTPFKLKDLTPFKFTYDPYDRRLSNLKTGKGDGNLFQNLNYGYDNVGNITKLENQISVQPANSFGGPTIQTYSYDDLYRLSGGLGVKSFVLTIHIASLTSFYFVK